MKAQIHRRRSKGGCSFTKRKCEGNPFSPPPPHVSEQRFCFGADTDCSKLGWQLHLIHDPVKTGLTEVRQVTNIRIICEALNKTPVTKTLLGEVHKMLRLHLTLTDSCHQNATRRGPQDVKIAFDITCGIGGFRTHIFCPTKSKNLP